MGRDSWDWRSRGHAPLGADMADWSVVSTLVQRPGERHEAKFAWVEICFSHPVVLPIMQINDRSQFIF